MKKKIVIAALIMLTVNATAAPSANAQNCKSPAQIVSNIWKKWGDTIIAVGCVAKSAAATSAAAPVTGGASLVATATLSAQCIRNTQKYKEAIEKMVSLFNDLADNENCGFNLDHNKGKFHSPAVKSTSISLGSACAGPS